jgi:hypothetical protein
MPYSNWWNRLLQPQHQTSRTPPPSAKSIPDLAPLALGHRQNSASVECRTPQITHEIPCGTRQSHTIHATYEQHKIIVRPSVCGTVAPCPARRNSPMPRPTQHLSGCRTPAKRPEMLCGTGQSRTIHGTYQTGKIICGPRLCGTRALLPPGPTGPRSPNQSPVPSPCSVPRPSQRIK